VRPRGDGATCLPSRGIFAARADPQIGAFCHDSVTLRERRFCG
jgi:hypothetical protein